MQQYTTHDHEYVEMSTYAPNAVEPRMKALADLSMIGSRNGQAALTHIPLSDGLHSAISHLVTQTFVGRYELLYYCTRAVTAVSVSSSPLKRLVAVVSNSCFVPTSWEDMDGRVKGMGQGLCGYG